MLRWGGHWVWIRIRRKSKSSQARLLFVCACLWCMHTCSLFMCVECIESVLRTVCLFFCFCLLRQDLSVTWNSLFFLGWLARRSQGFSYLYVPVLGLEEHSWVWIFVHGFWGSNSDPHGRETWTLLLVYLYRPQAAVSKGFCGSVSRQPWASASCFWQTMFRQRDFLQSLSVSSSRDFSLCFASWNTWRNSMKEAESRTIGVGRNGRPVIQDHKGRECQS